MAKKWSLTRRWNERTRLLVTLELAVVLPAAALIIASVLHLNQIKRDRSVEAAIQRDFSQVLAISDKQINHKAYAMVDDVRDAMPAPGFACSQNLDEVLASHPYAAHIFMYDPDDGWIFRSQPSRENDPDFREEAIELTKMHGSWIKTNYNEYAKEMEKRESKGFRYSFEGDMAPRGDKHIYQSVAFFLKKDEKTGRKALAAMAFDAEFLRDHFFPEMMETIISRNLAESQGEKNHAVIMIHNKGETSPIAASVGWDGGKYEVDRPMEGAFPGLALAMKMRGTTLEALGQRLVRTSFLILGGLSLLLTGGLILTYRNVSKEMA